MARLIVRNVDEEVVNELKKRAAESGRSVEAEHREILRNVLLGDKAGVSFKAALLGIPEAGRDTDFRRNSQKPHKVRL